MRPTNPGDQFEPRPRKSSLAEQSDRPSPAPATFFLTRGPEATRTIEPSQPPSDPVSSLQDTIDESGRRSKRISPSTPHKGRGDSRRRSTIKATSNNGGRSRRESTTASDELASSHLHRSVTPSPLPSQNISLPSSPKSTSSRSAPKSEEELTSDDAGSQAVASSEDDEEETPAVVQDSQPELIMPSIKMPSRRPYTARGKRLGRFKILVAGQKGAGKTSFIKSIVQVCEDIVHVDPLSPSGLISPAHLPASPRLSHHPVTEIYASTRPYPAWWSDLEESRVLRRRKSMGDAVLERNLCFVDTSSTAKVDHIVQYAEQQLTAVMNAWAMSQNDLAGMLSGRGGSQVDVILYLISQDNLNEDLARLRLLSEVANIIPLIGCSDLLTDDEQASLKQQIDPSLSALPRIPPFGQASTVQDSSATPSAISPYAITSINGPDLDNMDASLLMSPEYVQPLLSSELGVFIDHLFDPDTVAYLKHTSAKKLLSWHAQRPQLMRTPSPSSPRPGRGIENSTLPSPLPTSLSTSGVLVPPLSHSANSELSLNTSNSFALARVADHAQREERLAQIRLSKWASELQLSLQRERERYERLATQERATWLVQRMGEEIRDGHVVPYSQSHAAQFVEEFGWAKKHDAMYRYQTHDPLGLLRWKEHMRIKGWIALQVMGSFGVVGGLAFWLARSLGWTSTVGAWMEEWGWFGWSER